MRSAEATHLRTTTTVLFCPTCQANFPPSEENFAAYISSGDQRCPNCGALVDWWDLICTALAAGFLGMQYAPIRAHTTAAEIVLTRDEEASVNLMALGIPVTARILERTYTPYSVAKEPDEGFLMPTEVHGNTPDGRVWPGRPLLLYPRPHGGRPPTTQRVTFMVTWVDEDSLSVAGASLIAAVEALREHRHKEAVVPAAAAAETSIGPVLSKFLEAYADPRPVSDLTRRAAAAGQSDVLVPTVAGVVGAPRLPEKPREALRTLRRLRNRAAHDGVLPAGTTREEVAEAVAAAIFGVEYAQLLDEFVERFIAEERGIAKS